MLSACSARWSRRGEVEAGEHRRDDGEVLGHVVGDREGRQRAARHQELLADLDDLDELGRIGIEIDHVAGLARRDRAGVHGDADIGLGERRRVVGAVAAHGDELALGLLVADQLELVLRRRLGEEVVDAGLGGDGRRGHRVVAGDHDGADAHAAQLGEALADAALDDVLEVDDAEQPAVLGDGERRAARLGDRLGDLVDLAHGSALTAGCSARTAPDAAAVGAGALRKPRTASTAPLRIQEPPTSTPLIRLCAVNGTKLALSSASSRPRMPYFSLASTTIERPSGVSSASEASCAASASSCSVTPRSGRNSVAWRLPSVIVPVLSRSSVSTSPAASTARPDMASTLKRTSRSMPAMPIAESSAPMVVGISVTNSATRTTTGIAPPA